MCVCCRLIYIRGEGNQNKKKDIYIYIYVYICGVRKKTGKLGSRIYGQSQMDKSQSIIANCLDIIVCALWILYALGYSTSQ